MSSKSTPHPPISSTHSIPHPLRKAIDWVATQKEAMVNQLIEWVRIPSYSLDYAGIKTMAEALKEAFEPIAQQAGGSCTIELAAETQIVQLVKHLPTQFTPTRFKGEKLLESVLLGGHMDTVFPRSHPFYREGVRWIGEDHLSGPGVADMKGGLVILLYVLQAWENIVAKSFDLPLNWEVVITSDEEVGSPHSRPIWEQAAKRHSLGLLFEPSLPSEALVARRKAALHFSVKIYGKEAHSGRDFFLGRSAISAAAELIQALDRLTDQDSTVNIGTITGGRAANVVAGECLLEGTARSPFSQLSHSTDHPSSPRTPSNPFFSTIRDVIERQGDLVREKGMELEITEWLIRPEKQLDEKTEDAMHLLAQSGDTLGFSILWEDTGGVSDGNLLAAAGLPTIDTVGACGKGLHSVQEVIRVSSLIERAQLLLLFLYQWAQKNKEKRA